MVPGRTLEEKDMQKDNWELLTNVAKALARFHKLPLPANSDGSPMLWRTVDKMMDAVVRRPELIPSGMPTIDVILSEINSARAILERHRPAIVLGHGDCKPSNIIVSGECSENVTLIDFELSGPNYCSFDLMKLFRTAGKPSESCMKHFLHAYLEACNGSVGDETLARLFAEVHMFEPLTWLEASMFFLTLPMFKAEETTRWNRLAVDRWDKFMETKHKLLACPITHIDCLSLILAIGNTYKEDLESMGLKPLTAGFANLVWAAERNGQALVVKRYTDLVFLRIEPEAIGAVDRHAESFGVGPRVLYSSPLGLVAEMVPGRTLEEKDMHKDDWELLNNVAKALARFHKLPIPAKTVGSPMLWRTVDKMMDAVVRRPELIPPGMPTIDVILSEINSARAILERHRPAIVLGHGDCKPSNIIVSGDRSENVTLIDFELSGPNYRGFDLMKLFRTAGGPSESCMKHFLRAYAEACDGPVGDELVSDLVAEAHMFEPLTWLEASIFFLAMPMFEASDTPRWRELALDRWKKFTEMRHKLRKRLREGEC